MTHFCPTLPVEGPIVTFLTNCGPKLGFAALYVWGSREEGWITASPQGNAWRLSDEEAAKLLFEQGVRFPRPAGSVKWVLISETDTVDNVIANVAAASEETRRE